MKKRLLIYTAVAISVAQNAMAFTITNNTGVQVSVWFGDCNTCYKATLQPGQTGSCNPASKGCDENNPVSVGYGSNSSKADTPLWCTAPLANTSALNLSTAPNPLTYSPGYSATNPVITSQNPTAQIVASGGATSWQGALTEAPYNNDGLQGGYVACTSSQAPAQ